MKIENHEIRKFVSILWSLVHVTKGTEGHCDDNSQHLQWLKVDFTKEVNPSLAKPPLKFNGGLANLGLTSLVKKATGVRIYLFKGYY